MIGSRTTLYIIFRTRYINRNHCAIAVFLTFIVNNWNHVNVLLSSVGKMSPLLMSAVCTSKLNRYLYLPDGRTLHTSNMMKKEEFYDRLWIDLE
jgi:hypothetical protein